MRINVYAEEITTETEIVTKTVEDESGTRIFYGLRMFLKSAVELHLTDDDDDRSAITFWVKWTRAGGASTEDLQVLFGSMSALLDRVDEMSST